MRHVKADVAAFVIVERRLFLGRIAEFQLAGRNIEIRSQDESQAGSGSDEALAIAGEMETGSARQLVRRKRLPPILFAGSNRFQVGLPQLDFILGQVDWRDDAKIGTVDLARHHAVSRCPRPETFFKGTGVRPSITSILPAAL